MANQHDSYHKKQCQHHLVHLKVDKILMLLKYTLHCLPVVKNSNKRIVDCQLDNKISWSDIVHRDTCKQ